MSTPSEQLIQSDLFGHVKGAYTGADRDRTGWLEVCSADGTVVFDDLNKMSPNLLPKLLQVLEER